MSNKANRNQRRGGDKHVSKVVRGEQQIMADRKIKEKFVEERKNKPLVPMNDLQREYMRLIGDKDIKCILCCGYAGSSKTYIPTVIACDLYRTGKIKKIILVRPAISDSKSMGFFGGDLVDKCKNWLAPILDILNDRIGSAAVDIAIKAGDIVCIPLEVIKGRSFQDAFILVDESQDLTIKEFQKVVTRQGKNSKLIFAGDLRQIDLKSTSGLKWGIEMAHKYPELNVGIVDFDRPSDIVREEQVKQWILVFNREGY